MSSGTQQRPVTGVRSTRQRSAIAELLSGSDEFRSAQDLHDNLKAAGQSIGLTTVYRNLQALADAGQVDTTPTHPNDPKQDNAVETTTVQEEAASTTGRSHEQ